MAVLHTPVLPSTVKQRSFYYSSSNLAHCFLSKQNSFQNFRDLNNSKPYLLNIPNQYVYQCLPRNNVPEQLRFPSLVSECEKSLVVACKQKINLISERMIGGFAF